MTRANLTIGITMRVTEPGTSPERMDALDQAWFDLLHDILPEALLVPIPNNKNTALELLQRIEFNGLIFSGGNDWGSVEERDEVEELLLSRAISSSWPLLGVCRGMQSINVLLGGRLERDITGSTSLSHVRAAHTIRILDGQGRIFSGGSPEINVNSFHNQGVLVSGVASELQTFAVAEDDIVEGFFHPAHPIVGIQWHPERDNPAGEFDKALIKRLFTEGMFWKK